MSLVHHQELPVPVLQEVLVSHADLIRGDHHGQQRLVLSTSFRLLLLLLLLFLLLLVGATGAVTPPSGVGKGLPTYVFPLRGRAMI